jgi:hypothetical protein
LGGNGDGQKAKGKRITQKGLPLGGLEKAPETLDFSGVEKFSGNPFRAFRIVYHLIAESGQ